MYYYFLILSHLLAPPRLQQQKSAIRDRAERLGDLHGATYSDVVGWDVRGEAPYIVEVKRLERL